MEFEKILPLLVIWVIWRILNRAKKPSPEAFKQPPKKTERDLMSISSTQLSEQQPVNGFTYYEESSPLSLPEAEKKLTVKEFQWAGKKSIQPLRLKYGRLNGDRTRSFLRNAFVWSEILSPPKGLRDESGN